MALVHIYEDVFDKSTTAIDVNNGTKIKTAINNYMKVRPENQEFTEVYNAATGKTEYRVIDVTSYKIAIIVNGEETDLEYRIKKNDVVTIFFIPQSKEAALITGGVLALGAAAVLAVASGGAALAAGGLITSKVIGMGIGAAVLGAVGLGFIYAGTKSEDEKGKSDTDTSQKNLPSVQGSENESILDKRYPLIIGKHLIYPYIAGNPYHETHIEDIESGREGEKGQLYHIMYCAGYGPLRLTNFKLGSTVVAYNQSDNEYDRRTLLHGQLYGTAGQWRYDPTLPDKGEMFPPDITNKWKNNDVKLEILQAGDLIRNEPNMEDQKYGEIYKQTVVEREINSNLLFAYDYLNEEAGQEVVDKSINYKGASIDIGYRTNTIRLSDGCPTKVQVEIDMPNGYFAQRQEGKEEKNIKYYQVPINLAVQWRYVIPGNDSTDADYPDGWETFDYMVFDKGNVAPQEYTDIMRADEIRWNKGLSPETKAEQNPHWTGAKVFSLCPTNYTFKDMTEEEIVEALKDDSITSEDQKATYKVKASSSQAPYVTEVDVSYTYKYYTSHKPEYRIDVRVQDNGKKEYVPQVLYNESTDKGRTKKEGYNTHERRYVFEKVFTDEDAKKFVNFKQSTRYMDNIEVRVIRLTPCYLDEAGHSSDVVSDFSYQDVVKWTYLRTWKFDKAKYVKALELADDPSTVKADKYPEIFASDDDLNKFCFIGLQLKQDIANTAGSTLKRFSCIAESFMPNYDRIEGRWYPAEVKETFRYYHKVEVKTGKFRTDIISETEYLIHKDDPNYFKRRFGNNMIDQIRADIFVHKNVCVEDGKVKYLIPENVRRKYITSNTAAAGMMALLGNHLGSETKTSDNISTATFEDAYNFYEDITDGTDEQYGGLQDHLKTYQNLKLPKKRPYLFTISTKCYVITPSIDDGTQTVKENTEEDCRRIAMELSTGVPDNQNTGLLAVFTGTTNTKKAERYKRVLELITDIYLNPGAYNGYVLQSFNTLQTIPINALRSNIGQDYVDLIIDNLGLDVAYRSLIIDVMEQMGICTPSDNLKHVKFECNAVITQDIKLEQLIAKVFLTGRSYVKRNEDNRYEPLIGRPNPYPVAVLNQRNTLSKNNTKSFAELPCGFHVSFIDETDEYGTNDFYVMEKGEDYRNPSRKIEDLKIDYVTSNNQLRSLAMYNLACRLYQRESYTRTVGMIGHSITLGDTVLLQDDSLLVGTDNGGRIIEVLEDDEYIYGFTTDEPFNYEELMEDGVPQEGCTVVQPDKFKYSRCVTLRFAKPGTVRKINGIDYRMVKGYTNLVLLQYPIVKSNELSEESYMQEDADICVIHPQMDDLVAFGNIKAMNLKAIVIAIKPKENDKFDLTLVPYNEGLFNAGFEIPVFKSNMTIPSAEDAYPFARFVTADELAERSLKSLKDALGEETPPDDVYSLSAVAGKNGITLQPIMQNPKNLNNTPSVRGFVYSYSKDGGVTWEELCSEEPGDEDKVYNNYYTFRRSKDHYPESGLPGQECTDAKYNLINWKFRVKMENIFLVKSVNWTECEIDVSNYGTWIPPKPNIDNFSASAEKDWIAFNCDSSEVRDGRGTRSDFYGAPYKAEFFISRDKSSETGEHYSTVDGDTYYWDRDRDGYPEIAPNFYEPNIKSIDRDYCVKMRFVNTAIDISLADGAQVNGVLSERRNVAYNNYGTWIPPVPHNWSAVASKDRIDFKINEILPSYYYYGHYYPTFEVWKRKEPHSSEYKLVTKVSSGRDKQGSSSYIWNRETDGYPEKSAKDGETLWWGVGDYKIVCYYENYTTLGTDAVLLSGSFFHNTSDTVPDASTYGSWIPPVPSTQWNAIADVDTIRLGVPDLINDNCYGSPYKPVYQISRDGGLTWEGDDIEPDWTKKTSGLIKENTYYFDRTVDGYPEFEDLDKNYRFRVRYYNAETGVYSELKDGEGYIKAPLTENYGIWQLADMTKDNISSEVIDRTIILKMSVPSRNRKQYGTTKYKISIKRVGYAYTVLRDIFKVADVQPDTEEMILSGNYYIQTDNYTKVDSYLAGQTFYIEDGVNNFVLADPQPDSETFGLQNYYERDYRNVTALEDGAVYYIKQKKDLTDDRWYQPDILSNPHGDDEDCYKVRDEGALDYLVSDARYSQTMPLYGQNMFEGTKIQNTSYMFRITAFNESGKETAPLYVTKTALCTSIVDIVHAHEYYKEMYIENLSAISADIGMISRGGLGSIQDRLNYWVLSDLDPSEVPGIEEADKNKLRQGAFRVGGKEQFFEVEPIIDENGIVSDYSIRLKAGNISLSSSTTTDALVNFTQGTFINDDSGNYRMCLTPNGLIVQRKTGDTWDTCETMGQLTVDINNNMIFTNCAIDDSDLPQNAVNVKNAVVYHFNTTSEQEVKYTAEGGSDIKDLSLLVKSVDKSYFGAPGKSYNAAKNSDVSGNYIRYDMEGSDENVLLLASADKVRISDTYLNYDGSSNLDYTVNVNKSWGLTDEQLKQDIFKEKVVQ